MSLSNQIVCEYKLEYTRSLKNCQNENKSDVLGKFKVMRNAHEWLELVTGREITTS